MDPFSAPESPDPSVRPFTWNVRHTRGGGRPKAGDDGDALLRRHRLAEAGARVAATHGLAHLTMRGVAAEAGVRPSLLNYYFRDVADLLDDIEQLIVEAESSRSSQDLATRVRGDRARLLRRYELLLRICRRERTGPAALTIVRGARGAVRAPSAAGEAHAAIVAAALDGIALHALIDDQFDAAAAGRCVAAALTAVGCDQAGPDAPSPG